MRSIFQGGADTLEDTMNSKTGKKHMVMLTSLKLKSLLYLPFFKMLLINYDLFQ